MTKKEEILNSIAVYATGETLHILEHPEKGEWIRGHIMPQRVLIALYKAYDAGCQARITEKQND